MVAGLMFMSTLLYVKHVWSHYRRALSTLVSPDSEGQRPSGEVGRPLTKKILFVGLKGHSPPDPAILSIAPPVQRFSTDSWRPLNQMAGS
jgi:hypothetical protein